MADREALERLFTKHGCEAFTWIEAADIVVAQWVRVKCLFGCDEYGMNATCPPHVPAVDECKRFFGEYTTAVVFHFPKRLDDPDARHDWGKSVNASLLALEREVFLAGYHKAFALFMSSCGLCNECPGVPEECRHPESARPTAEGLAMDVFSTVRKCGLPIEVLATYDEPMNRYAFLLVE